MGLLVYLLCKILNWYRFWTSDQKKNNLNLNNNCTFYATKELENLVRSLVGSKPGQLGLTLNQGLFLDYDHMLSLVIFQVLHFSLNYKIENITRDDS